MIKISNFNKGLLSGGLASTAGFMASGGNWIIGIILLISSWVIIAMPGRNIELNPKYITKIKEVDNDKRNS